MKSLMFETQMLLEGCSGTLVTAVDSDPLAWSLSDQEQAVWDELSDFRAEHPVRLGSLEHPL